LITTSGFLEQYGFCVKKTLRLIARKSGFEVPCSLEGGEKGPEKVVGQMGVGNERGLTPSKLIASK